MMNDIAIANINNILQDIITKGDTAIGIVYADQAGHMGVAWRTNDFKRAKEWEDALKDGYKAPESDIIREKVTLTPRA